MTGVQRFFMLVLCVLLVMVLYPNFGTAGWPFVGTFVLVWTGIILIMSIVGSLFGLYRYDGVNRFLNILLFVGIMASLLWYFPQEDKISIVNKIKHGQFPTGADVKQGINQLTFNFAFDRRNARSEKNFVNQPGLRNKIDSSAPKTPNSISKKAMNRVNSMIEEATNQ
ncbi:MAG: hypothetical protein J6Y25_00915 [Elusimicrobiaceae bacterium]|nr:hypothetical protein [Elusimicrobiaceae bacterium]